MMLGFLEIDDKFLLVFSLIGSVPAWSFLH